MRDESFYRRRGDTDIVAGSRKAGFEEFLQRHALLSYLQDTVRTGVSSQEADYRHVEASVLCSCFLPDEVFLSSVSEPEGILVELLLLSRR